MRPYDVKLVRHSLKLSEEHVVSFHPRRGVIYTIYRDEI